MKDKRRIARYHEALERWHELAGEIFAESQVMLDRSELDALEAELGDDRIRRAIQRILPVVGSLSDELMGELEQVIPRTRDVSARR